MEVNSATDVQYTELRSVSETENTIDNNLGKDDFLNILVMQMANQNPLEPTSDTDFIAQLAQFSMLEQIQNLATNMDTSNAYSMVGKEVVISVEGSDGTQSEYVNGKVDGVVSQDGIHYVLVGDEKYPTTDVVGVLDSDSADNSGTEA